MTPPAPSELSIFVVDDDTAVRDALMLLFAVEGYAVQAFSSGDALLGALDGLGPGCVVMDVRMPGSDGTKVQAKLARLRPDLPVILVTGDGDIPLAVKALQAGAVDFLEKPFAPQALLDSVKRALGGLAQRAPANGAAALVETLTPREREVLQWLIAGETNKEIARRLGNSPRTIEVHRSRVMQKLSAHTTAEMVRIALSAGLSRPL